VKESPVVHACLMWFFAHGMEPIRNNTGGFTKRYTSKKTGVTKSHFVRFGKKGTGDIIVCTKTGKWCEVEAKGDGEQNAEQAERQKHVESLGGIYILARSIDDLEARRALILG
jgi:hypothetical protein